uniref:Carbohydrate sulfotransferase 11 n=1 Tax=Gopherus evgoodei TaxID=1825980 RepID=A0A8C4YEP0_9SAUR
MKQALMEVMRMNRICRMVLVTCFGSFILVIFYFQSMLHPGMRSMDAGPVPSNKSGFLTGTTFPLDQNRLQVIRRNPFGMDICCRKGSRSPLQELYNPIQPNPLELLILKAPPCCVELGNVST